MSGMQEVSYAHYVGTSNTACSVGMMRFQHEQLREQSPDVSDGGGHLRSVRGQRRNGCHSDKGAKNSDPGVGEFLHIATKRFDEARFRSPVPGSA